MSDLRPVKVLLNSNHDGLIMNGFFHKFTQGNMANDAVIIEDMSGVVHVLDFHKDIEYFQFIDRRKSETNERKPYPGN